MGHTASLRAESGGGSGGGGGGGGVVGVVKGQGCWGLEGTESQNMSWDTLTV